MSNIENQYGMLSFPFRPDRYLEGQQVEGLEARGRPYYNPIRCEQWTLTFGGTESNGIYTATLTGEDGSSVTQAITRTGDAPATNTDLAEAWVAALLANPSRKNVIRTATAASGVATVIMKHPGSFTLTAGTAPGSATLVAAETVSTEGQEIPCGRFVQLASLESATCVQLLQNSATEADIAGVVLRPHTGIVRPSPAVYSTLPPAWPAGDMVVVNHEVIMAMLNVSPSTAAVAGGVVYAVVNTAGGQLRGQARADDDGSNSIAISTSRSRWLADTPAGALGPVLVRF